jgi:hemolysin III
MSDYTRKQELANIVTHAAGILFGAVAVPVLLYNAVKNQTPAIQLLAIAIYGFSLLLVFSTSTIYHSITKPKLKKLWRSIDHIAIFFLIAGSATPIVVRYVPAETAKMFLIVQWSLVLGGTIFKLFFTGKFRMVSTLIYIAMGMLPIVIGAPLFKALPPEVYTAIIVGGVFYITGAYFYMSKRLTYSHAIWHVFVLGGSIAHFAAIGNTI